MAATATVDLPISMALRLREVPMDETIAKIGNRGEVLNLDGKRNNLHRYAARQSTIIFSLIYQH